MNQFILEIKHKVHKARSKAYMNRSQLNYAIGFNDQGIYNIWANNEHKAAINYLNQLQGACYEKY